MGDQSQYHLGSVDRALTVLNCFTPGVPELRLIDISRKMGISKIQALRLTSTLEAQGFLARDPRTKFFRLGIRLFQLGMYVQQHHELQRIAHPFLQELVGLSGETARTMIPDRLGPTCIDVVEPPRRHHVFGKMGGPHAWHAGTSPKLLLAYQSPGQQEEILSRPLKKFTPYTSTDPGQLRAELAEIRARGHHVSTGDIEENATAVAAPIFDRESVVVGAISVSGPTYRIEKTGVESMLRWVLAASTDISRALGHHARFSQ